MADIKVEQSEVTVSPTTHTVEANDVIDVVEPSDLIIEAEHREYTVVSDNIYMPQTYDESPQWLQDWLTNVVNLGLDQKISDINSLIADINTLIAELDIAKNAYTNSIITSADIDSIVTARVETLNSDYSQYINSTIIDLVATKVTATEAANIATQVLQSGIVDPETNQTLSSLLTELKNTYSDLYSTMAQNVTTLQSSLEGDYNGVAGLVETLNTYVGIDAAGASTGTGLSAYLEDPNTGIVGGADSKVANLVEVDNLGNATSKFEYSSLLNKNGVYYKSGFGLSTLATGGTGTEADPYDSEFWINAAKFKFTNDNVTGQVAPFTIDASGTQPKITFNGLVTFGSGQTGTIDEAIASTVETIAVGDKNINITDNLIPTTSLVADTDNSGYQFVGTPTKGNTAGIDTFAEAQIVLDTGDEVYSPYVDEMTIPYYYRFGFKGSDLSIFKITTIDNLDVATYNTVTVQLDTALVGTNWYIIDGIINPTGGDNVSYSGSVKLPDGTKVGSIQNFVLPSGTVKLVLGWVEPCTISRMKLAKITADTITNAYATQDYVQNQGYVLPAGVADAINNNTTTINGSKITTGSIAAEKINTQGLIAENISADTIYGKTLSGSIINGARINGAVIKASYLDLDGQLEVLTNYHLCTSTAQLNAIISAGSTGRLVTNADKIDFGGDAVYITADNEWRIPSLRAVSSTGVYITPTYSYPIYVPVPAGELHSSIYSYNYTTAGSNIKAVKQAPPISINYSHPAVDTIVSYNSRRYYLYIGTKKLIAYTSTSSTAYSITSDYSIVYNGSVSTTIGSRTGTAYHYTINGNIKVSVETYNSSGFQGISLLFDHISAMHRPESYTVTSNLIFESGNIYCSYDDSASVGLPAISIDNMV